MTQTTLQALKLELEELQGQSAFARGRETVAREAFEREREAVTEIGTRIHALAEAIRAFEPSQVVNVCTPAARDADCAIRGPRAV